MRPNGMIQPCIVTTFVTSLVFIASFNQGTQHKRQLRLYDLERERPKLDIPKLDLKIERPKLILVYTTLYHKKFTDFYQLTDKSCKNSCIWSIDLKDYNRSDGVLFSLFFGDFP